MSTLLRDVRYAIRNLIKRPGFTLIALATLALGIGANTAIFSLVNTVLLRPLPVPKAEQIVSVAVRGKGDSLGAFSYPNYKDFRDRNQVLSGLLLYRFVPLSLSSPNSNERIWGYSVSGNYFDVLGVGAIKGRTFAPEEDRTLLTHPVIVISYGSWQRRFGGDPDIIGKQVLLNNHPFTIIGVAPEGFRGTEIVYTPEVWVPISMISWVEPGATWLENRDSGNFFGIGRLKDGVSVEQAQASLKLFADQLAREYPDTNEGMTIVLTPPGFIIPDLRGSVVSFTWILMAAVAVVLLITCTNLAGLLLARATERRKEIAIRFAMGAKPRRLITQLLTENIFLSLVGGVLGFGLSLWIIQFLLALKPPIDFPLAVELSVDWRVLLFSLMVSVLAGAVFGLAPALQSTRTSLTSALKETTAQGGHSRSRLRSTLVVAQLAFSLIILIAAGLVGRALAQLQTLNPGFDPTNTLTLSFELGLQGYEESKGRDFQNRLLERLQAIPGVKAVAAASNIPLSLNYSSNNVHIEGHTVERGTNQPSAMVGSVSPKYFETMRTPILYGREFTENDKADSERVVVVNETFVRRIIPEATSLADAVGRRVSFKGEKGPYSRIVGVVKDGKYFNISEEPRSFVWDSLAQDYTSGIAVVIRTDGPPESFISAAREAVRSLDPNLPLFDVKSLTEHMKFALFPARVAAVVLGAFGFVALTLAAIGLYGVTAYSVSQRTREIGIRMALGAQMSDVLRTILRHAVILIVVGIGLGLLGAFLVTRLLISLLSGVSATDPVTFIFVSLLLIAVAFIASYLPARRATKVDPLVALRYE